MKPALPRSGRQAEAGRQLQPPGRERARFLGAYLAEPRGRGEGSPSLPSPSCFVHIQHSRSDIGAPSLVSLTVISLLSQCLGPAKAAASIENLAWDAGDLDSEIWEATERRGTTQALVSNRSGSEPWPRPPCCVTSDKSLYFSEPLIFYLQNQRKC